ncbi:protein phosphatase Slingshot-like isoform X2 [Bolinopsis microptera]|uniref:protein phosphatase Slingshot-like isoform X2 n=1 Tax=Bolinopsis microptera TaxID=2820187 RepID=UPI00307A1FC1
MMPVMLTIELSSGEEEEEDEKSLEENDAEEENVEISADHEKSPQNDNSSVFLDNQDRVPELTEKEVKGRMVMYRNPSTEKFQAAVTKVKLANSVVRRLQFHTTRTVARAIDGPDSAPKRQKKKPAVDLGHFPAVLRMICRAVRTTEQCYLVVELVSPDPEKLLQYLVILRNINEEGQKEDMMLGAEAELIENRPANLRFCVGVPVKSHVTVKLDDGDGSFVVCDMRTSLVLKPANIQSQWAAINFLSGSLQNALDNNFFLYGKSHKWCSFYTNQNDMGSASNWNLSSFRKTPRKSIMEIFDKRAAFDNQKSPIGVTKNLLDVEPSARELPIASLDELSRLIVLTIRSVMYNIDLDEASCKSIRTQVEKDMGMSLNHYKNFIEEKILMTLGQMDEPSLIKDYLYLGSEWNACNYEELVENGITHILNVTSEIDSPFESSFDYLRIEVLDVPKSNLLEHWENTHKYIKNCRDSKGKVLVHCQMGISRSGSTTMSYLMREYDMSLSDASSFVKHRRSCVKPNWGFQKQLELYQKTITEYHNDEQTLNQILDSTDINELYAAGGEVG